MRNREFNNSALSEWSRIALHPFNVNNSGKYGILPIQIDDRISNIQDELENGV